MQKIKVSIIAEDKECLPLYASEEAAGADVRAFISKDVEIFPGHTVLIPTGIKMAIPKGYEIQVRPRSGLALKHQLTILNTPGTIDSDYRGEICIILTNHGKKSFVVKPKMRIAQLVLAPVIQAEFALEESLTLTKRGEGGFGHTGTY